MGFSRFAFNSGCMGFYGFGLGNYLIIGGIFLVVVAGLLWFFSKNNVKNESRALDILKEKYVLGEISEEEYLKKKELLERK